MTISRSIHVVANGIISFFFWPGNNIPLNVYRPHLLYPFTCRWTFKLLPCLDCCKWCCYEYQGALSFQIKTFLKFMPRIEIARSYISSVFTFSGNYCTVFHSGYTNLHSHEKCRRIPFSAHPVQNLLYVGILMMPILTVVRWLCSFEKSVFL